MQSALQLLASEFSLHWLGPEFTLQPLTLGDVLHWFTLGGVLLGTLAVGICAHELFHLVPLSLADASYTVTVLPSDESGVADDPKESDNPERSDNATPITTDLLAGIQSGLQSGLVRVEVTHVRESTPEWLLRVAALLPLALALPLVLVLGGVLPDPISADNHVAAVALIALTGCGLPSPADWSVAWHGSDLSDE